MRNTNSLILPPDRSVADDLVALARADKTTYNRRRESTRRCVNITGAEEVLAELRSRLDATLDSTDPAAAAVALAATIGEITR